MVMGKHFCGKNEITSAIHIINADVHWVFHTITVDNEKSFLFSTNCDMHGMDAMTYSRWFLEKWTVQFVEKSSTMPQAIKCRQCRNQDMETWQSDFGSLCTRSLSGMKNEGVIIVPCFEVPPEILIELNILTRGYEPGKHDN